MPPAPPVTKTVLPASSRMTIKPSVCWEEIGAGEGIRTLDPDLGKVVLYP
jgi:hypothetical protein